MSGVRRRWLDRWLHQCDSAPARGAERTAQRTHRAVGTRLSALCASGPPDRIPAGDAAVVGPLAQGHRYRRDGRAYAARLDDREREACVPPRGLAGTVDRRIVVAAERAGTLSSVLDRRRAPAGRRAPCRPFNMLSANCWRACWRMVPVRPIA